MNSGESVWHRGGNIRDDRPANLRIVKRDLGNAIGADQGDTDHCLIGEMAP